VEGYYGLDFLNEWRNACQNTNVYRTLKVLDLNTRNAIFLGPFLIDIDSSTWDNGYEEHLNDAQSITHKVVEYLTKELGLSLSDLHIFFSGRKGFNIEVRPEAIGINGSINVQARLSSKKLDEIITFLRNKNNITDFSTNVVSNQGTVIDRIYGDRFRYNLKHPYIRLSNSVNSWIGKQRKPMARTKAEKLALNSQPT